MGQWFDEDLVAIIMSRTGGFRIRELPPRVTYALTNNRRTFRSIEQAELYIEDQYPTALKVDEKDITEEIGRRKVILSKLEEEQTL